MLNIGDIVTLSDDKEYVVVNLTNYNDNLYVYVTNMNNIDDTQICLYENSQLITVEDEELIDELENIFATNNI